MTDKSDIIIETEGLTKKFGNIIAVNNINIIVSRGEIFGLLGTDGSGKSTTLSMLVGLIAPSSGSIKIFNKSINKHLCEVLPRIGIMSENHGLYPFLSAWDNLYVFGSITGNICNNHISQVLDIVGLSAHAKEKVENYSQGMKQRLSIASVLLNDPQLILLDEPTSCLDPAGIKEVRELIINLGKSGKTIFLNSHLLNEVEQVCNRVAIINKGNLLIQGEVKSIIKTHNIIQLKVPEIDRAMILLREQPWISAVFRDGEYLLLEAPANKSIDVSMILAQKNIFISEIKARENSLEDFLFPITGNSQRELNA